jgi:hypothetical protein
MNRRVAKKNNTMFSVQTGSRKKESSSTETLENWLSMEKSDPSYSYIISPLQCNKQDNQCMFRQVGIMAPQNTHFKNRIRPNVQPNPVQ